MIKACFGSASQKSICFVKECTSSVLPVCYQGYSCYAVKKAAQSPEYYIFAIHMLVY